MKKKPIIACLCLIGITIIIAIIVIVIISVSNRIDISQYPDIQELKNDFVFMKAVNKCDTWFSISVLWLVVEYLLAIIPIELIAAIVYIEHSEKESNRIFVILFSVLSIALIIMTNAIRPHDHTQGYRRAYVVMDHTINTFIGKEEKDNTILIDAMNVGECYISNGFAIDSKGE